MNIEQYLTDEQDPKTAEKVLGKINDMLTPGEQVLYLAVQKKPAVNLVPDSVAVTDKRLVFCIPANLGLTTNFEIFSWKDIKEIAFKEEFFGAKFTAIPYTGENFTVDYIPRVQARKLYQFCNRQLDRYNEQKREEQREKETKAAEQAAPAFQAQAAPQAHDAPQTQASPSSHAMPGASATQQTNPFQANEAFSSPRPEPASAASPAAEAEDEVTLKLKKLKTLFEKQLITQDEYEAKKADILSQL